MTCERCGRNVPTTTIETKEGTHPTELCEQCIGIVINPGSHFRLKARAYTNEQSALFVSLLGEASSVLETVPNARNSDLHKRIAEALKDA